MSEHTLDLACTDDITWEDFIQLRSVKDLMLINPTMTILDVTPDGMPDIFTDTEMQFRQLSNLGLKVTREAFKQTVYEEL